MIELTHLRTENSKTYDLGKNQFSKRISMGSLHYKDDYTNQSESWKDIDLTIVDGKVTKAPYELTIDGNKVTVRCKRTGRTAVVETISIGNTTLSKSVDALSKKTEVEKDVDYGLVLDNEQVSFQRTIKSANVSHKATFKISGDIPVKYQATDSDGLPVAIETSIVKGVLTETIISKEGLKYPIKVDPTLDIKTAANADDVDLFWNGSAWALNDIVGSMYIAYYNSTNMKSGYGMRFLGVNIPAGATINNAHITYYCYSTAASTNNTVNSKICGELSATPATFSNAANYQGRRGTDCGGANNNNRTTAEVAWDSMAAMTKDVAYNTPDIKTVVQEICDLGAITNMVIFHDDHANRSTNSSLVCRFFYAYNDSSSKCPQLYIDYTPVAGHPTAKRWGGVPFMRLNKGIWCL